VKLVLQSLKAKKVILNLQHLMDLIQIKLFGI
jgi:hypothetical protein